MKKNIIKIFVALIISIFLIMIYLVIIRDNKEKRYSKDNNKKEHIVKIGLIVGPGGFGDKSFNDMQYNGMMLSQKKYKMIKFEYKEPETWDDIPRLLNELIDSNCKIIISSTYVHKKLIIEKARENRDRYFILLDSYVDEYLENFATVNFKQNEGSFLAGALAGLMTKTDTIGFIGGQNMDVIQDFLIGYKSGAEYVNKNIKVYEKFINEYDPDSIPWSNPQAANKLSLELINKNDADIIFGVAAASNFGVFQAVKNKNKFAIGVDSDQDYLEAGTILTSMMKNIDQAIIYIIGEIINNRFENKAYVLGIKEKGVGLSPMIYTRKLMPEEYMKKIEQIKQAIIDNKLEVPSAYH